MAKKYSYNVVSKYISLPAALIAAIVAVIILVVVGLKYSSFNGDLLSARVSPSGHLDKCKDEHNACLDKAVNVSVKNGSNDYKNCTEKAKIGLNKCYSDINEPNKSEEEAKRNQCEENSALAVLACTLGLANEIKECAPVMYDCLEKTDGIPGVKPAPEPGVPETAE